VTKKGWDKGKIGPEVRGEPTTGRITRILRGQGHGFIRAKDGREVFFHRGDVPAGTFNTLEAGDTVELELLEDVVSGARALKVRKSAEEKRAGTDVRKTGEEQEGQS
jgi:cold shock CspA family protein